jgi:hypothetical protein
MKSYLIFFIVLLFAFTALLLFNESRKVTPYNTIRRRIKYRALYGKVGSEANGLTLLRGIDLLENQFVYKMFVTNDGILRLQVDAALVTDSQNTIGPIQNVSQLGEPGTQAGNYTIFGPPAGDGTFNNLTLVGSNYPALPSSTSGSGGTISCTFTNGIVTSFQIVNAGVNYSVGDTLTIYFRTVDANGNEQQVPRTSNFQITVLSIQPDEILNPALQAPDWNPKTTVRDYGASAVYGAGEFFTNGPNVGTYRNYKFPNFPFTDTVCSTLTDPQQQWFCIMDYTSIFREDSFKNARLLATTTILATTSEIDDLRVYHLVLTYRGLGILAAPRGAVLTIDLYEVGYTDLFDDLAHARCGATDNDDPFEAARGVPHLGLPGLGLRNFYAYPCRYGCANMIPPVDNAYQTLIWEMASPNGKFRAQFFDSGHFRFVATFTGAGVESVKIQSPGSGYTNGTRTISLQKNSVDTGLTANITFTAGSMTQADINPSSLPIVQCSVGDILTLLDSSGTGAQLIVQSLDPSDPAMFETNGSGVSAYPQCGTDAVSVVLIPSQKPLDNRKDAWIIRGISYYDKDMPSGIVSMATLDIMVSLTDSGALILQKDYQYNNPTKPPNHIMTQGAVGYTGSNLSGYIKADPLLYSQNGSTYTYTVTDAPTNDDRNYHWNVNNSLACYGPSRAGEWEIYNGHAIAVTPSFVIPQYAAYDSGLAQFYTLWLSPYGLRLFRSVVSINSTNLSNFQNCLWITPFDARGWYRNGNVSSPFYTDRNYCKRGPYFNWPLPTSDDVNTQWAGQGGRYGNPFLQTCGSFQIPIPQDDEVPIISLYSTNRRYVFQFMSSGRCLILDFVGYTSSSNANILYDCCDINRGGYRFSPPIDPLGNVNCFL